MSGQCHEVRLKLLAEEERPPEGRGPLQDHLLRCAACRQWLSRAERLQTALRSAGRASAPFELEGRVAASLQPGHRQERICRVLPDLEGRTAPEALDERVAEALRARPRAKAPRVLGRLVVEELAAPLEAQTRRHLGRMGRRRAPAALDLRAEDTLRPGWVPRLGAGWQRGYGSLTRGLARLLPTRGRSLSPELAAAALLLLALGVARLAIPAADVSEPSLSFQIVRLDSASGLSPMARALIPTTPDRMLGSEPDGGGGR